jgi:hypothetical protein
VILAAITITLTIGFLRLQARDQAEGSR